MVNEGNPDKPLFPDNILNWIGDKEYTSQSGDFFENLSPDTGRPLCLVTRSHAADVKQAIDRAMEAQSAWAAMTPVKRGEILLDVALNIRAHREEVARIVALETGKSYQSALGETDGAVALGTFMAGEGQRLYGRTTTSGTKNKWAMTIRQPLGVAGLIIAANTPIANVAWKVFPALICGNSAILKAPEDTPVTAWIFCKLAYEAGLPAGVLNVIQGYGEEAGEPLVTDPNVDVVSFTGSTKVGKHLAEIAGRRLAKLSLELGGKNPLVVCDDADLDKAADWVLLSAFSNAGQRCASGSRIIIFDNIYDTFCEMLVERTRILKVGPTDDDYLGAVINEKQLFNMTQAVEQAVAEGARVLIGGQRITDPAHKNGFYMAPTLIDNVDPHAHISVTELFGPIACLYHVHDFPDAIALANDSPYGLTACIHSRSIDRALQFTQEMKSGVVMVNAGTYGSEPHVPFGGLKQSGNGSREPGTEALDIYSELKDVYLNFDPV